MDAGLILVSLVAIVGMVVLGLALLLRGGEMELRIRKVLGFSMKRPSDK